MNEHMRANQRWWDEAVPIHAASQFYDVASFKAGKTSLLPVELRELGDVRGKTLLHLQCHFGLDTLSWAREGAIVTGVDFSQPGINAARLLAAETGIEARFIHSDLYGLGNVLQDEFDIVFTSYGVLIWLNDIREWARIVASYLKPGGVFYIVEGHPLVSALDDDATSEDLRLTGSYFERDEATAWHGDGTYADRGAHFENQVTYEYSHSLGDIISALVAAGLQLEFLHEHEFCAWARLPSMTKGDDGYYRLANNNGRFPFMFSLRARKPG